MNRLYSLTALVGLAVAAGGCNGKSCDPEEVNTICTIVGSGENGYDIDADNLVIDALEAKFSLPQDTLVGPEGQIYILDWNNHRLRVFQDDEVRWVAGRGELGGSLDDPANGDFNHPTNMIFDGRGNIIIAAWHNSKIRVIDPATGKVSDSCGDGARAYFGDGGDAMTASLDLPASIALSPDGNLVIMDQANQVLRYIDDQDNIQLLAGRCVVDAAEPAGPGPCPDGEEPTQCPAGDDGPSGKYTCGDPAEFCSKPCTPGYAGDGLPASEMRMAQPFGQSASPAGRIAYSKGGELYFADSANNLIRKIDKDGLVQRVAGTPPQDGVPQFGYAGDGGPATEALLNFPVDLAFADDGTLYFTDVQNHCVRAIDPDGTIDVAVGVCGQRGYEGDGGPPKQALLKLPFGLEWDDGRLIISDTGNNVIRTVVLP